MSKVLIAALDMEHRSYPVARKFHEGEQERRERDNEQDCDQDGQTYQHGSIADLCCHINTPFACVKGVTRPAGSTGPTGPTWAPALCSTSPLYT